MFGRSDILEEIRAATQRRDSSTFAHEYRVVQQQPQAPIGAVGRWFVTPDAVHRYQERIARLPYEVALAKIIDDSLGAHRVKPLHGIAELWRGPKPRRLRYIVLQDAPGLPVLVTVLPAFDRKD